MNKKKEKKRVKNIFLIDLILLNIEYHYYYMIIDFINVSEHIKSLTFVNVLLNRV